MKTLNPKQEAFCHEYLIDSNGTQAAIRAGYSKKTAKIQAAQHLTKLNITSRIEALRAKTQSDTILTSTQIQEMLTNRAKDELDANGLKALDMLNKMHGAYTEKIEMSGQMDVVQYYAPKKDKNK